MSRNFSGNEITFGEEIFKGAIVHFPGGIKEYIPYRAVLKKKEQRRKETRRLNNLFNDKRNG